MAGDFNVIADLVESLNSSDVFVTNSYIRGFTDCCIQLLIFNHAYSGPVTWTNKHMDGFIAKKLDRVLVNDNWIAKFILLWSSYLQRFQIIVQL